MTAKAKEMVRKSASFSPSYLCTAHGAEAPSVAWRCKRRLWTPSAATLDSIFLSRLRARTDVAAEAGYVAGCDCCCWRADISVRSPTRVTWLRTCCETAGTAATLAACSASVSQGVPYDDDDDDVDSDFDLGSDGDDEPMCACAAPLPPLNATSLPHRSSDSSPPPRPQGRQAAPADALGRWRRPLRPQAAALQGAPPGPSTLLAEAKASLSLAPLRFPSPRTPSPSPPPLKPTQAVVTEAYPESEFNVRGAAAEGAGEGVLSIEDMLEGLGAGVQAAGLKKRLSKLEKDKARMELYALLWAVAGCSSASASPPALVPTSLPALGPALGPPGRRSRSPCPWRR